MSQLQYLQRWAHRRWWSLRKKLRVLRVDPAVGWVVSVGVWLGGNFFSGAFGGVRQEGFGRGRSA